MTTHTKRRGRRSLAAILAAMLMASVLAVVAGSPAHAANTSNEVLIDTNSDGVPDAREFAGQDRYDTALHLAKNFATSKGGLGSVTTAFIASGDTLVDSISVAGLAGYVDAPILLTPSDGLHGGVQDFIEDYGVNTVYLLGGAAAVSDSVVTAIEELTSKPTVDRVSGDDRYATATAIASKIETESSWCGTDAVSAVLINGSNDALAFGVAAQTIAYRLQLPLLMTATDELPDATADYITANDVEHVQIIGGTGTVSAGVASALTTLGVDTVARVDGDTASAVSVELAQMAGNGCGDALGLVSNDRVALVRGNPDGVVAAPVLASSLAGGYLVSPLIVGTTLPASVRDYLAATPTAVNGAKLNLGIVATGGTAAVSETTMSDALAAAASSGALTATIAAGPDDSTTADVNENDTNGDGVGNAADPVRPDTTTEISRTADPVTGPKISLHFSDNVEPDLSRLQDIIEINGVPAVVLVAAANTGGVCDRRRIDVTLGQHLNDGDTISIVESDAKFGTATDQRTVAPTSITVTAAAPDRTRPTATVLAIAPGNADGTAIASGVVNQDIDGFAVTFRDDRGFPAMTGNSLDAGDFTFVPATGKGTEATNVITANGVTHTAVTAGAMSFTVTVQIGRTLAVGDRLIVKPGIVSDRALPLANVNAGTSGSAIKPQASPRIASSGVLMSELKHSVQNLWTVPDGLVGGVGTNGAGITIRAKADGDAAGAAGNDWTMLFDRASTHSPTKPLDIDVRVDTKGKRVVVRFNNGPASATLGDLLKELKANPDFDARFSAGFTNCTAAATAGPNDGHASTIALGLVTGETPPRDVEATSADTGRTQFAIEVRFNAHVGTVNHDELLHDVLAAAARRAGKSNTVAAGSEIRAAVAGGAVASDGTVTNGTAGGGLDLVTVEEFVGPKTTVRYEATTALVKNLPKERDLVDTDAGHAGDTTATPIISSVTAVATGYARDIPVAAPGRNTVDESDNGASQRRIQQTSSVKARN